MHAQTEHLNTDKQPPWWPVQWLGLCAPNAGGPGVILGQGARPHMLQLRVCKPQLKIPNGASKSSHKLQVRKKKKIPHATTKDPIGSN